MKKILYLIVIILGLTLLLKGCLKRDLGYDEIEESGLRPLDIQSYDVKPRYTKTVNGVDYLVSTLDIGNFGGEIITSAIGEGPKTFNPFVSRDATSSTMSDIMFEGLLGTNPYNGERELKMARRLEVLPDKKTYIVELRHGITWSDGVEITADDVYYTYNTIIFGGFGNTSTRDSLYIDGKLPHIEKLDKYTVKFTTPEPFAPFLKYLSTPIAPKHVFKAATDKGVKYFDSFYSTTAKPKDFVVSGAFKLKEYVPAQRVIYEKNPNYYVINEEGKKLPYVDKWVILIVGDINNEEIKFEAGEIDVVSVGGDLVSKYREDEEKSDYKLYNLGATTTTLFVSFNLNRGKDSKGKFYVEPKKQAWFNDINFRRAIDYTIDRDSLVLNVLRGVGQPLFSAESPSSIFLNKKVALGHKRDVKHAKELLEKSGFYLKDGILYDKNHNRVEFELLTNAGNNEREAAGVSIKEDLSDIGIKVNFKPIEFNTLVNRISNTLDFDAIIIGLTSNPLEPHGGYNVWGVNGTLHIFNQRLDNNLDKNVLPWERELDEIYQKGARELDFNKRKEIYDKYQEIVYENAPFIYLYSPINIVAVRKKLGNVYPTQLGGALHNIEEIYIK